MKLLQLIRAIHHADFELRQGGAGGQSVRFYAMSQQPHWERAAIATAILAVATIAWLTSARASQVTFHVDAGDAAVTLNEYSRQAGLQVLFDFNVVRGRLTRAIAGDLDPDRALTAMLAGSGLVFDLVNDRTLAVMPAASASGATDTALDWEREYLIDRNGYLDCVPARYTATLLGYTMFLSHTMEFCLMRVARQ